MVIVKPTVRGEPLGKLMANNYTPRSWWRRVRNYSASVHARGAARSYILMDMDGSVVAHVVRDPEIDITVSKSKHR